MFGCLIIIYFTNIIVIFLQFNYFTIKIIIKNNFPPLDNM